MIVKKQPRLTIGYECTPICEAEKIFGEPRDVLDATRHYERFEHDFDLQESLGIKELRYPACWDKVLVEPYKYDFSFVAPIMESMRRRNFVPTIDLCHHKVPRKIKGGFANPEFPNYLLHFALAFQAAFPFVERYTLVNEPAVTALFHSNRIGLWEMHNWSDVFLNMAEAIAMTSRALKERNPNIKFFHTEPIDHDVVKDKTDKELVEHVAFLSQYARFGMDDLLRGKIYEGHPFFEQLLSHGADPERVLKFEKNPAEKYERDLDFYIHCFKTWFRDRKGNMTHVVNPKPPSLVSVINEYKRHLPDLEIGLGETNVRGTVRDRITFCKWILEQCAEAGLSRVAWWGLTDAALWGEGNFTRYWREGAAPDPVGIFSLSHHAKYGRHWNRRQNEFSETVRAYANGQISIADFEVYPFSGQLKKELNYYSMNHCQHWQKSTAQPIQLQKAA
jgi:hypothetical protein